MHDTLDATLKELFGSSPELFGNKATMEKLTSILRHSLQTQELLASKFKSRQIGSMEFRGSALVEHKFALARIKETIGADQFYNIFGEEGDYPELLIEPDPFKEAFEHRGSAD